MIKELDSLSKITFLGKTYTKDIVCSSKNVDYFLDWSQIQKKPFKERINTFKKLSYSHVIHVFPNPHIALLTFLAKIPTRVGTVRRFYHRIFCNFLSNLSRKKSSLHEAQLNMLLVRDLFGVYPPEIKDLRKMFAIRPDESQSFSELTLLEKKKFNLVFHPFSKGNGRNWPIDNFIETINLLSEEDYEIFFTGLEEESLKIQNKIIPRLRRRVHNLAGKLSLKELMLFLLKCDGFISAGTGPLHIAAALGVNCIGLFPPMSPIGIERWGPIGVNAEALVYKESPEWSCKKDCELNCDCMKKIKPKAVVKKINAWFE
jgi:ADP-heptose:LPS heptosyltransferase